MLIFSLLFIFLIHGVIATHVGHLGRKYRTNTGSQRTFELNISLDSINPDCHHTSYPSLVANHEFPSLAMHIVKDDIVRIKIRNSRLHNNQSTSVHFHGIRQYGTSVADGVANITQLAIAPGQSYTQVFQVSQQTGTYYYHAHVGVQDDTILGPFIVYENEANLLAATDPKPDQTITEGGYTYNEERILQWSEYWHQSGYDRLAYYLGTEFKNDLGPDSILLNGKSIYSENYTSHDCEGFSVIDVEPNTVYRFRFISSLTFRILAILIQDHDMTLIEIDGEYVQPHELKYLEMAAGQRMSVLIKTGDYPDGTLFPIATNFRWRALSKGYTPNGYGYLRYNNRKKTENKSMFRKPYMENFFDSTDSFFKSPSKKKIMEKPNIATLPKDVLPKEDIPGWILRDVKPLVRTERDVAILGGTAATTIKLSMEQLKEADNTTRFRTNGRVHQYWGTPTASLLDQVLDKSLGSVGVLDNFDGFSTAHQTYPISYGQIVDFVFQNVVNKDGICVNHPWHTHGHSHYLIAEGAGDYQHALDKDVRSFDNPLLKDVSMSYPANVPGTTGCGWTKVRVLTDNPGVWAVHCHLTLHMLQGKMIILEVAPELIKNLYF
ncbi:Cupredoxin [Helicostylum pulchrum]|nr:Cupredoxin [Helicostylum pulchrum]